MNLLTDRDFCAALVLSLGHFLWQGLVIAALAAVVTRRFKTAHGRYVGLVAVLSLMAVCPSLTLAVVAVRAERPAPPVVPAPKIVIAEPVVDVPPVTVPTAETPADVEPMQRPIAADGPLPTIAPPPVLEKIAETPAAPSDSSWQRFAPLMTDVYLLGVMAMLLRLTVGLWGGWQLRRRSIPVTDAALLQALKRQAAALGMKFVPMLAYCERVAVPTVIGILKPSILLPLALTSSLAPDQVEAVLAHELAHLRRYDHLVNLMQRVIESLLFLHPAVWWLSHKIRVEREHCCDDLVVASGAVPLDYAKSLLRVAELSRGAKLYRSISAVSLLATGQPSTLRQRIARLLGDPFDSHVRFGNRWPVICLCIACVLLACLAVQIGGQPAAEVLKEFVATFPDDVTVELVGVTFHTSSDEPESDWWTPSGRPLAKGRIEQTRGRGKSAEENYRTFVVEVRGAKEPYVRVAISPAGKPGSFSSWWGTYGRTFNPTIFATAGPFVNAGQTTVRVMLATDDWGPVQQVSTSAARINELKLNPEYSECYGNVSPQRVDEQSSRASLTISWPQNQDDLAASEVWAVDKEGKRHEISGAAAPQGSLEFSFGLPLSQIARFEYRLRPYQYWVTFQGVSVEPGKRSDVSVSTKSLPVSDAVQARTNETSPSQSAIGQRPDAAGGSSEPPVPSPSENTNTDGPKPLPVAPGAAPPQVVFRPVKEPPPGTPLQQDNVSNAPSNPAADAEKKPMPGQAAQGGVLSVRGRVMIDGPIPEVPPLKLKPSYRGIIPRNEEERLRDRERWEAAPVVEIPDESLVIGKEGAIANVAIYLKKAPKNWKPSDPSKDPVELRAEDGGFRSRMSLVRVGQPLRLMNRRTDVVNFHSFPLSSNPFNVVVALNATFDIARPFTNREPLPVAVVSDIQPWMKSWLIVLDHPFAAITDAEGRFEIRDLPPGEHHFTVWHERRGYLHKDLVVLVEHDKVTELNLKYTAEQLERRDLAKPNAPVR